MSLLLLIRMHKRLSSSSSKWVNEIRLQYELEKQKRDEYAFKHTHEVNLRDLSIDLRGNSPIQYEVFKHIFSKLVKGERKIDYNSVLNLLKAMNVPCIDLFPIERQQIADKLLEIYLKEYNRLENPVLNNYLETSFYNNQRISEHRLQKLKQTPGLTSFNIKTNAYLIRELCYNGLLDQAIRLMSLSNAKKQPFEVEMLTRNSIMHAYFKLGKENEAIDEFKRLNNECTPSGDTYFTLINGYILLGQEEKAFELYSSVIDKLSFVNLLDLYQNLSKALAQGEFSCDLIERLKKFEHTIEFKMHFCQTMINLITHNHTQFAYNLIKHVFEREYTEEDVDNIDVNTRKIDVLKYFFKYMIKSDQSYERMREIVKEFDSKLSKNQNYQLKNLAYEALSNDKCNLSLRLIEDMSLRNIEIKWHFFLPLMKSILRQIQIKFDAKPSRRVKFNEIKQTNEYTNLKNIFSLITKYKCLNSISDLETFYHTLFEDLNFYQIEIDLFELSSLSTDNLPLDYKFNLFLKKLSSILSRNLHFNCEFDSIKRDFKHMLDWLVAYNTYTIEDTFYLHLNDYFNEIEKQNFTQKVMSNMSLQDSIPLIIGNLNKRRFTKNIKTSELLEQVNEKFLNAYIRYNTLTKDSAQRLGEFYVLNKMVTSFNFHEKLIGQVKSNHTELQTFLNAIKNVNFNSDFSSFMSKDDNSASIEHLECQISSLKMVQQKPIDQMRQLIQILCNKQDYLDKKTLTRIDELERELTLDENHTTTTYSSLMLFYSARFIDFEKAKYFYERLANLKDDTSQVDLFKIVTYVDLCLKNGAKFEYIYEVLKSFNRKKTLDYLKDPMEAFIKSLFPQLKPNEFESIVNIMIDNNYTTFNIKLRRFIIAKYLKNGQIDEALEKFYFHTNNLIPNDIQFYVAIDLMRESMVKNGHSLVRNTQLNQLLKYLNARVSSSSVVYHFLFISLIQLEKYEMANSILKNSLNCVFSTDFLDKYLSIGSDQVLLFKDELELTLNSFKKYSDSDFKLLDEAAKANCKSILSVYSSLLQEILNK